MPRVRERTGIRYRYETGELRQASPFRFARSRPAVGVEACAYDLGDLGRGQRKCHHQTGSFEP